MGLKGTKSEENLRTALAGESMARNKYTYYAMAARRAGQDDVAAALERMAQNEMMHAKFWFEQLYGKPEDTRQNLINAIEGELQESDQMYPAFARQARADGLEELALMFEKVAGIEADHARQFMRLLNQTSGATERPVEAPKPGYRCMFCGAVYENRPDVCGVCQAIGSFEAC